MSVREVLHSGSFKYEDGLFFQQEGTYNFSFEKIYTSIRQQENRMYPDEIVRLLPCYKGMSNLEKEWVVRKKSAEKLIQHLQLRSPENILEVGCGNGWLTHQLAEQTQAAVAGIDVLNTELLQAARLFNSSSNNFFVCGDVFRVPFPAHSFNAIVVASSLQYFKNLNRFIQRLLELTDTKGEIHILDSPIYTTNEIPFARRRSENYFRQLGFPEMAHHYFHHAWDEFDGINYSVLYNPTKFSSRLKRFLSVDSRPFYWVMIPGNQGSPTLSSLKF
jgi:ubiquinone/menaquinone biosynthesis C-methylase UbiE